MSEPSVLIVGPSGASGIAIVDALRRRGGCRIYGLSRRDLKDERWTHISADLLDASSCRAALKGRNITHLFYAARAKHGEGGVEAVPENRDMLANVVAACAEGSSHLRHVHLVEGGKWYGQHLGPYRTPSREDDPRHMPPNFYYDQQDWLSNAQRGQKWTWSASRPNVICGFAPERARNLSSTLAVYGAICAELGVPMDFPGTAHGFETLTEVTEAGILGDALVWLALDSPATNSAFNVTNGDAFRWSVFWPDFAAKMGVRPGITRNVRLGTWMADKAEVWAAIAKKYGLREPRIENLVHWDFADFVFRQDWDVISDLGRLRRTGFANSVDSQAMFIEHFDQYRAAGYLPARA
jgi:nucleoside-diphosphate-sugar epimerase